LEYDEDKEQSKWQQANKMLTPKQSKQLNNWENKNKKTYVDSTFTGTCIREPMARNQKYLVG